MLQSWGNKRGKNLAEKFIFFYKEAEGYEACLQMLDFLQTFMRGGIVNRTHSRRIGQKIRLNSRILKVGGTQTENSNPRKIGIKKTKPELVLDRTENLGIP